MRKKDQWKVTKDKWRMLYAAVPQATLQQCTLQDRSQLTFLHFLNSQTPNQFPLWTTPVNAGCLGNDVVKVTTQLGAMGNAGWTGTRGGGVAFFFWAKAANFEVTCAIFHKLILNS